MKSHLKIQRSVVDTQSHLRAVAVGVLQALGHSPDVGGRPGNLGTLNLFPANVSASHAEFTAQPLLNSIGTRRASAQRLEGKATASTVAPAFWITAKAPGELN